MLPDGTYDVVVVDAAPFDAAAGEPLRLELTIVTGDHKGEVATVSAVDLGTDWLDLLGMPATLRVRDGEPTVTIDR